MTTCNCGILLTTNVEVLGNNLVLTIPDQTYINCKNYTVRIAQSIPTAATGTMPVAIKIGEDGSTLYNIVRRCGHYLYSDQIRSRRNYTLRVAADTLTFSLSNGYISACNCGPNAVMPVATPASNITAANKKAVSKDA